MVWLRNYSRPDPPRVRLVCFPHAGGSASAYAHWAPALPASWQLDAVKYPGREDRILDPPMGSFSDMAQAIADELASTDTGGTCVVFGHSMGSYLAYEVAVLRQKAHQRVDLLVLSGAGPQGDRSALAARVSDDPSTGDLLARQLLDMDPDSAAALSNPELRDYVLRTLSWDLDLLDRHHLSDIVLGQVPVLAISGRDDPHTSPGQAAMWAGFTTGPFAQWVLPGGHFYLRDQLALVVAAIRATLDICQPGDR